MKLLVVGMSPLPLRFYQALKNKYEVAVRSLNHNSATQLATNRFGLLIIWSDKLSYLTVKKLLQHLFIRFPKLKVLILGDIFSSPERAELLMLGVKDCVAQSICPEELLAKIGMTVQIDQENSATNPFNFGKFSFNFLKNLACWQTIPIPLNKKETLLLRTLIQHPNTLLSKHFLYDLIWDSARVPSSNSLEVYVSSLRRKIEKPFGLKLIETVKGVGYRMKI